MGKFGACIAHSDTGFAWGNWCGQCDVDRIEQEQQEASSAADDLAICNAYDRRPQVGDVRRVTGFSVPRIEHVLRERSMKQQEEMRVANQSRLHPNLHT